MIVTWRVACVVLNYYRLAQMQLWRLSPTSLKSAVVRRLQFKHFRITSAASEKLIVRTLLRNCAVFNYQNAVHHADCGETMGDQHRHFAFGQIGKALEDFMFGPRIQCGG